MRVPCVRVRLPGRGPPRACACDRARPHTKRSESGIRIRDPNPLSDAAAPPEHVLLPGTRPGDLPAPPRPGRHRDRPGSRCSPIHSVIHSYTVGAQDPPAPGPEPGPSCGRLRRLDPRHHLRPAPHPLQSAAATGGEDFPDAVRQDHAHGPRSEPDTPCTPPAARLCSGRRHGPPWSAQPPSALHGRLGLWSHAER